MISPLAVFVPADDRGVTRPVEIGAGCQIGPFTVIYGGSVRSATVPGWKSM